MNKKCFQFLIILAYMVLLIANNVNSLRSRSRFGGSKSILKDSKSSNTMSRPSMLYGSMFRNYFPFRIFYGSSSVSLPDYIVKNVYYTKYKSNKTSDVYQCLYKNNNVAEQCMEPKESDYDPDLIIESACCQDSVSTKAICCIEKSYALDINKSVKMDTSLSIVILMLFIVVVFVQKQ